MKSLRLFLLWLLMCLGISDSLVSAHSNHTTLPTLPTLPVMAETEQMHHVAPRSDWQPTEKQQKIILQIVDLIATKGDIDTQIEVTVSLIELVEWYIAKLTWDKKWLAEFLHLSLVNHVNYLYSISPTRLILREAHEVVKAYFEPILAYETEWLWALRKLVHSIERQEVIDFQQAHQDAVRWLKSLLQNLETVWAFAWDDTPKELLITLYTKKLAALEWDFKKIVDLLSLDDADIQQTHIDQYAQTFDSWLATMSDIDDEYDQKMDLFLKAYYDWIRAQMK